jgi:glycerol transport system ATP-binding protein
MARIDLDLAHSYRPNPAQDSDYALLPLKMSFEDGGAYALLGPSGCGKSTMLNIMSGLLVPSHGSVKFDGADMTRATPQERNIAQVFQFPVIYDTMTVAENLAFPLKNRRVPKETIRQRVGQIAEMLEMSHQLDQRAAGLSADQKQKISLGRGLVRPDVAAVLFDEPLTVIDPHLKWQLRRKLKQIHHELKLTLIYVTHDQVEALTFADQVVVMTRGRVVQQGTPDALFERPAHTFVGHFIGSPGMNFLPATLQGEVLSVAGQVLGRAPRALPAGADLRLGIRPEYLALDAPGTAGSLPAGTRRVLPGVTRPRDTGAPQPSALVQNCRALSGGTSTAPRGISSTWRAPDAPACTTQPGALSSGATSTTMKRVSGAGSARRPTSTAASTVASAKPPAVRPRHRARLSQRHPSRRGAGRRTGWGAGVASASRLRSMRAHSRGDGATGSTRPVRGSRRSSQASTAACSCGSCLRRAWTSRRRAAGSVPSTYSPASWWMSGGMPPGWFVFIRCTPAGRPDCAGSRP